MAEQEQNIVRDFVELLKKKPELLASLSTANTGTVLTNEETTGDHPEEAEKNQIFSTYSVQDLLMKRSRRGKGSGAQQTFRVSLFVL